MESKKDKRTHLELVGNVGNPDMLVLPAIFSPGRLTTQVSPERGESDMYSKLETDWHQSKTLD